MQRMLFVTTFFLTLCLSVVGQKVIQDANAEKRTVSGFHAVSVSGGIDLYITPGEESVAVSASETKYRDRIRTEVKDGVLKIWYDYSPGWHITTGNRKMKAYVSVKQLDKLSGSGGSDIFVEGSIQTVKLNISISGGSDFKGRVEATDLSIHASGGSDVKISGKTTNLDIDASGGSDFDGYELESEICKLEASGGSDMRLNVQKELTANASGGSDIYYKGNGVVRNLRSSGSSGIRKVS